MKQDRKSKAFFSALFLLLIGVGFAVFSMWSGSERFVAFLQVPRAATAETAAQYEQKNAGVPSTGGLAANASMIEKERFALNRERKEIQREREQLAVLQKEIDEKLTKLSALQARIDETIGNRSAEHEKKVKHLIKAYTSMAPKKTAALMEKLDIDIVTEVFSKMKGDVAGKILSYMKPEKAAQISKRLIKK